MKASEDESERREVEALAVRLQRGFASSQAYMVQKWNYNDTLEDTNQLFHRPFNRSDLPLSFWELDVERRRCIVDAPLNVSVCGS